MKEIILLLPFTLFVCSAFAQDKAAAEKLVSDGIRLHDRGDYDGAIKLYNKALDLDTNNYLAMAEKAMSLNLAGKHADAVEVCKETVLLHADKDNLWTVYVTWGNSLDAQGKSSESLEVYDQGIAQFPDSYLLYFNKGITMNSLELYDESVPFFQGSARANPDHAGSHNAIARMLYGGNRIPSMLAFFRFFIIEPEGPRAVQNLTLVRQAIGGDATKSGNSITISFDGSLLPDTTEDGTIKPDDFATVDFMFTLQCALIQGKTFKKMNEAEKFRNVADGLFAALKEQQEKNSGFYWSYYVPYFVEMHEKELTEPFAYLVFASSGEKYVKKWFEENRALTNEFYKWSDKFAWYKG